MSKYFIFPYTSDSIFISRTESGGRITYTLSAQDIESPFSCLSSDDFILGYCLGATRGFCFVLKVIRRDSGNKIFAEKVFEIGKHLFLSDKDGKFTSNVLLEISYQEYVDFIKSLIAQLLPENDSELPTINTSIKSNQIDYPFNRIVMGAPGTGKSKRLSDNREVFFDDDHYERVTFYPTYSFSQFVGSYKPTMETNQDDEENGNNRRKTVTYSFIPGPFIRIYQKALASPKENFLLLIEELNRANAPAVFGDLFQLLDRDINGTSKYPISASEDLRKFLNEHNTPHPETLIIPGNMYIWASMNNADQGVFPLDTAFKRRWSNEYIGINDGESELGDLVFNVNGDVFSWNSFRKAINALLLKRNVNEDKLLGPFFVEPSDFSSNTKAINTIKAKVLMYLYEDAARQWRNSGFFADCGITGPITYNEICKAFDTHGGRIFGIDPITIEPHADNEFSLDNN